MVFHINIFLLFYKVICWKYACSRRCGSVNVLYSGLFLIIVLTTPSKCQLDCGNLTLEYLCHSNHVDAKIKLDPNDVIRMSIQQDNSITWYYWKEPKWIQISHNDNPQKYDEETFSIIIHDVTNTDTGNYALGCMHEGKTYRSRNLISLDNTDDSGCDTETSTGTSTSIVTSQITRILVNSTYYEEMTSPSVIFNSTVISVLAVCSVIIVLVLAGTVIFVVRKRGITRTALSRLASHEGGSTVNLHPDTESSTPNDIRSSNIYNEIDTNKCKGDGHVFSALNQSTLPLQNSPALPRRPSKLKPLKCEPETEYDMITEDTKYSKTNDPMPGTSKHDDDYATICQEEEDLLKVKNSKAINNNSMPEYAKVIKRPVYAQVQKRKESNVADASKGSVGRQDDAKNANDYNVVFPAIDYANVVTELGNNESSTFDEPVKYCNLAAKRRSERKPSNKSLKYAVLDHTGCDAYIREKDCGPYDLPEFVKLVSCQYASIDFDKKAFVAPIRKAPSSWYKRNRKQKKK